VLSNHTFNPQWFLHAIIKFLHFCDVFIHIFIVSLLKLCYFQYEKKKTFIWSKKIYANILNKDLHVLFCSTSNPLIMLTFSLSTILKKIAFIVFVFGYQWFQRCKTILNSIRKVLGSLFCPPLNKCTIAMVNFQS